MSNWQQRTVISSQTPQQVQSIARRADLDGEVLDIIGDTAATLRWGQDLGQLSIISGGSNYSVLNLLKGSILKLWRQFFESDIGKQLSRDQVQFFQRRLGNLEHQVDGLLKRRIQFSVKDTQGGQRFLDYSNLLNEKEVQIVELEKKIQNLEERLRRASLREKDLEGQIERLRAAMLKLEKPGVTRIDIQSILRGTSDYKALQLKYNSLRDRLLGVGGLIKSSAERLRTSGSVSGGLAGGLTGGLTGGLAISTYSGSTFDFQNQINALIKTEGLNVSVVNGVANIIQYKDRVVEVPVSDARTKHLIHLLAVQMKKFFEKYPKLRQQCDVRLAEFFQQQLIDLIEVDEIDRIVQIVKYVPDIYRVENVYAYSSQKTRRVEFHLRVLLKAILQEFEKIKRRTGQVFDIDEGVIGMINAEIMDVVNVDDILKVFRVVPKIVEVEKIVEKIVDRVIQIPVVIPVEKIVEKIIERPQIVEVEKIVHVPVQIVKYVDVHHDRIVIVEKETEKIVEVPRIIQRIVDRVVEIPKLVTEQIIVERVIEVQRPTVVQKIIYVPVVEVREVEVIKQRIVTVEKIIEKAVPVEVVVQKIVERVVHVPQLVTVQRRNDVLVKQIEVQNAREVVNHIQRVPEIVEIVSERPVPLIQTVERIVQVPKIIEKIVEVRVEVPIVQQVRVIEEKIVYVEKIREVQRIVTQIVEIIKEVEKIVDRRVQVPIVVEKILRIPEIITQIVVEKIENPVIVEVEKYVEKIVEVPKIIEVETVKIVEVTVDNPIKIIVEKIVQVPKTIERIKEVRVNIDKIIEKMVEVPKVVEVEKIVEKIVVVPRVIEKVIEVPQIVEKIVDRIIEHTQIIEVEKIVQVPMYQDRVKVVQVPVNTYITEKDVVQKVVEKIVPVEKVISTVQVVKQISDRIVEHRVEVPREVYVDRIVPIAHEVSKVVEIEKQIIIPVEVPVPVDRIIEKVVQVQRDIQKIVQCPQTIQKIVEVKVETIKPEIIIQKIAVPVFREQIREIERVVPYVQTQIREIKLYEQKIVLNNIEVEKIVTVDRYIQKIVTQTHEIIKAIQVQKLVDKPYEVQKIVTVDNFIPVLVEVNKLVEVYRDRPIEIPLIHHEIQEVKVIEEKVVAIEHRDTQIKQVITNHDRIIEQQKFISRTDIRNVIETQIQIVERYEDKIVPITTSVEKIIEIPYILEKIVQKIVIMPQVVEVLKYVHEIVEQETLGVAVGVDVYTQEAKYKGLYGKLKVQFEALLVELRRLRTNNPALKAQIQIIEAFLVELDKLIAFPRIVQVDKEIKVQVPKNVAVLVPTLDGDSQRLQVTLSLIVGKLVEQLTRIRQQNPNLKLNIDTQILKIFSDQYRDKTGLLSKVDGKVDDKIHNIYKFYDSFLNNLGGNKLSWEQQLMYTAALEERLLISSLIEEANLQIAKSQAISDKRAEAYRVIRQTYDDFRAKFEKTRRRLDELSVTDNNVRDLIADLTSSVLAGYLNIEKIGTIQPMATGVQRQLYSNESPTFSELVIRNPQFLNIHHGLEQYRPNFEGDAQFEKVIRARLQALYKQNDLLRERFVRWQRQIPNATGIQDRDRIIDTLQKKIVQLSSQLNRYKGQSSVSVNVVGNTQQYELKIRTLNSKNQQLQSQIRTLKLDYESKIKTKQREIQQKDKQIQTLQQKLKIGDSRATAIGNSQYTPSRTSLTQDRMSSSGYSGTSGSEGGAYSNYSSTSGSRPTTGLAGSPSYASTTGQGTLSGVYGQSNTASRYGTTQPTGTGTTGSTYGQTGVSYGQSSTSGQLSGSGASYGQVGGASYGQQGTSGQLSGSGASYGQAGGASYGQQGTSSQLGSSQSSSSLSQRPISGSTSTGYQGLQNTSTLGSGTGTGTGTGASYTAGQSGSTQGLSSAYNQGGYSRNYGAGNTLGSSSSSNLSSSGVNSSYNSATGGFSSTIGGRTSGTTSGTTGLSNLGTSYTKYGQNQ